VREGSEEYLDSEKYQLRHWDLDDPRTLAPLLRLLNDIRRRHPALERLRTLTGFKHKFTLEQTIDDLIASKRAARAETEHGDGTLVRNQS
jgi:hypothetical protein